MVQVEGMNYKRIAGYTALVLATLTLLYVVYRLEAVVLLFVLSVVVAAAMRKPMLALKQRRIPRSAAILLLYVLVLSVLGALIYFLGAPLGEELTRAGQQIPQFYDTLVANGQASNTQWQQVLADRLPRIHQIVSSVGERGPQIAYQVVGLSYGIFNVAISLLAILTLTFYWLIDEDRFVRLWLMLLPVQQRMVARNTWHDIEERVGTFVRSESIQFVLTLVVLWSGFGLLGVNYPTAWAVYGAIAQLIPWIGVPLTLLPVLPMALTAPLPVVLGAATLIIVAGVFMDRFLEPRLGVQGVVHPIVSVLALMLLGEASGILGMLVALPLAAALQSILSRLVQINTAARPATRSIYSTQIQDLRARVADIQTHVPDSDHDRKLALEGLFRRLDALLDKTEQEVQGRASAPEQRRMPGKGELDSRIPAVFARHRSR